MSVKYFDICDVPFKRDSDTGEVWVVKESNGVIYESKPSEKEAAMFGRNWFDSSVISKETAERLAKDPSISY